MRFAIITANTEIYQGNAEDKSGNIVASIIEENEFDLVYQKAIPSDRKVIAAILERMTQAEIADVIFVIGGCGCGVDDVTPEATLDVVERRLPGISEQLRNHMMTITKHAMLNRCEAGIVGKTLMVDLPGKDQAAKEAVKFLLSEIVHCVKVIQG